MEEQVGGEISTEPGHIFLYVATGLVVLFFIIYFIMIFFTKKVSVFGGMLMAVGLACSFAALADSYYWIYGMRQGVVDTEGNWILFGICCGVFILCLLITILPAITITRIHDNMVTAELIENPEVGKLLSNAELKKYSVLSS